MDLSNASRLVGSNAVVAVAVAAVDGRTKDAAAAAAAD